MLEEASLLLHSWSRYETAENEWVWRRRITDGAGKMLGFVCFEGEPERSWWHWFRQQRLDVFETEDASHLMSLTRNWGVLGSWVIRDAEGNHVGNLYSSVLLTSEPAKIASLDVDTTGNAAARDMQGRTMARMTRREDGFQEIAFTMEIPFNPFVRMLVLASFLTLAPMPVT